MYRIVVVDDEDVIVNGIYSLLIDAFALQDVEVYKFNSPLSALDYIKSHRVDILLTDINMPVMNGLTLASKYKEIWPQNKVIFLTGYDEFEYAQQAIRSNATEYVLKVEGDDIILEAVKKALSQLDNIASYAFMYNELQKSIQITLPLVQQLCIKEIIDNSPKSSDDLRKKLDSYSILLNPSQPCLLFIATIDNWHTTTKETERLEIINQVHRIVNKYLGRLCNIYYTLFESRNILWLVQPINIPTDINQSNFVYTGLSSQIKELLEPIQKAISQLLRITLSFAFMSDPIAFSQLDIAYRDLDIKIRQKPFMAREMIYILPERTQTFNYKVSIGSEKNPEKSDYCQEKTIRYYITQLNTASIFLSNGDKTSWYKHFNRLFDALIMYDTLRPSFCVEIYYSIVQHFVNFLNQNNDYQNLIDNYNISTLYTYHTKNDWRYTKDTLQTLAEAIFLQTSIQLEQTKNKVIAEVNTYLTLNLAGDTSLSTIADYVHLNPSYLSRLYRQEQGMTLSDFIIQLKIEKAKQLLSDHTKKIFEVALAIGFDNPSYFTQFFKKHCHMSPLDYRDKT